MIRRKCASCQKRFTTYERVDLKMPRLVKKDGSRTDFEAMNRAIELHHLHPVIDRIFPFAEAKAAYRHFEGRGHFGKVVITHG